MAATHTLVQRHKSRGIKTWYIRTCVNGRESFKSTKTTKKVEAMKIFAAFLNDSNSISKSLADLSVKECADMFLNNKRGIVNGETTMVNYRNGCKAFLKFCDERNILTMNQVTQKTAQDYSNYLSEFMKPTSVSCRVQVSGSIFNEVLDIYDINQRNPFDRVKKPRFSTKIADFWTMEQVDTIIENALNKYYAALWGLMAYAGLRFTEARRLRVENVDGRKLTIKNGKGGRDAVVPISEKLKVLLDAVIEDRTEGSIFDHHLAIKNDKSIEQIKKAVERSGLKNVGRIYNHKFRHSFASELLRKGVNVKSVQVLGRWHRADVMLKHYVGVVDKELDDAVNLL